MMLFSFLFCTCATEPSDVYDVLPTMHESVPNVRRRMDVCAVLAEQTIHDHLVFLYKIDKHGVEAQVELIATRQDPLMRCRMLSLTPKRA